MCDGFFETDFTSKKKFQSLTITLEMNSPDEVITIYKKAAEFKDVITL